MPEVPPATSGHADPPAEVDIPALSAATRWRGVRLDPAGGRLVLTWCGVRRAVVPLAPTTSVAVDATGAGVVVLRVRGGGARVAVPLVRRVDDAERSVPPAVLRLLADTLERHRAGGARTAAVQLRAHADHVESVAGAPGAGAEAVPTAGAVAAYLPRASSDGAPTTTPAPEPAPAATVLDLRAPTPTGPGEVVAHLDIASAVLRPARRTLRTGPTRFDRRATVTLTGSRTGVALDVQRPLRWRRAGVPLLDLRPGRTASQPPAVLRALADVLRTHAVPRADVLVPQLRAQAAHVEAGGALDTSPLAPLAGGGGLGHALAGIPDL